MNPINSQARGEEYFTGARDVTAAEKWRGLDASDREATIDAVLWNGGTYRQLAAAVLREAAEQEQEWAIPDEALAFDYAGNWEDSWGVVEFEGHNATGCFVLNPNGVYFWAPFDVLAPLTPAAKDLFDFLVNGGAL